MEKRIDTWYIERALSRHYDNSQYFFMTQVKNWPTFSAEKLLILDWVAIKKSWTAPRMIWFEIKVSRWDFLQDQKRVYYQQYVNDFFFVCPEWLIKKDELPDNVGLMYVTEKWIKTVKRSKFMPNTPSNDMLMYIIHNKIESTRFPSKLSYRTSIHDYVEDKISWKQLSMMFRSKLIQKLNDYEINIKALNEKCSEYKSKITSICERLNLYKANIDIDREINQNRYYNTKVIDFIDGLHQKSKGKIDKNTVNYIKTIHRDIKAMSNKMETIVYDISQNISDLPLTKPNV